MPLKYGLLRSYQTSLGAEVPLRENDLSSRSRATSTTWTRRSSICRSTQASVVTAANHSLLPTSVVSRADRGQEIIDRLTDAAARARVRPRDAAAPAVEDAASSAGSRTRCRAPSGSATAPGRRTTSIARTSSTSSPGCRCAATGTSACACSTRAAARPRRPPATTPRYGAGYFRFDFRVDKRAVWRKWLLDFYVDVTNAALLPEEVTAGRRSSATCCPPSACAAGSERFVVLRLRRSGRASTPLVERAPSWRPRFA